MFTLQAEKIISWSVMYKDLFSIPGAKKFFAFKTGFNNTNLKDLSFGKKTKNPLPFDPNKEYDAVVIGGGSGGLSFASEAKELGLNVLLFNHVDPTPKHKFQWGLGNFKVLIETVIDYSFI